MQTVVGVCPVKCEVDIESAVLDPLTVEIQWSIYYL